MADQQSKAPSMGLDISVGENASASADFSADPKNPVLTEGDGEGLTLDFERDGSLKTPDTTEPAPEANTPEDAAKAQETPGPSLPDYDAGKPEVVKAYEDAAFTFNDAGGSSLNMAALGELWEANGGSLPDGMYGYLQDTLGISKDAVKEIEAGRVALRNQATAELYGTFGGKEGHDAAFQWATGAGGYSQDQKARFNEAVVAGGAALKEQMELLKTRFDAATGQTTRADPRRPAAPRRTIVPHAAPGAASGAQPYADNMAYLTDARAKGFNNPEVRKRLEASSFWKTR